MALTKDDPEVLSLNYLIQTYEIPIFAVDLIKDAYNTTDPFLVSKILKEIFEIDDLSIEDIIYMISNDEVILQDKYTLSLNNIF